MSVKLAYTNANQRSEHRYPDGQTLMRRKTLRDAVKLFKVGGKVLVGQSTATIIAYNISEFGRWISTSHPVMARLESGELIYCRLNDLESGN